MSDAARDEAWQEFDPQNIADHSDQFAFFAGHAAGVRHARRVIIEALRGQGIALDSTLDNWTFHAPFWAIDRAFDPPEEDQ